MRPASRITDMHVCPMVTPALPPIPHVGGPVSKGAMRTLIGMLPAARVTDLCICVGPPDVIAMGSMSVLIESLPAARIGDPTLHGGALVMGCPTVLIGG
ncbi:MAG TPA: PAAR domain-containing protein [Methylomirabilota bacterium]|nr:PAAR domain-containing protein [Methylomirabilota bacterium]